MKSYPFDSEVTYDNEGNPQYDRSYTSKDLRTYNHLLYTDGVFAEPATGLQVMVSEQAMSVTVMPGNCNIQGAFGIEESQRTIVFEAAGTTYDRIDSVVARLDENRDFRKIDLYVIKGTEATPPVAPDLTRTGGVYEIRLANVFIAKNTALISGERITDTRFITEDCGIVVANPQVVNTDGIFNQYQASLDKYMKYVQECIDGTTAGSLQAQIQQCFQSVSDGKTLVASAITDKGVPTTQDATFATMAANILAIATQAVPDMQFIVGDKVIVNEEGAGTADGVWTAAASLEANSTYIVLSIGLAGAQAAEDGYSGINWTISEGNPDCAGATLERLFGHGGYLGNAGELINVYKVVTADATTFTCRFGTGGYYKRQCQAYLVILKI